jgi:arylsulfatase A-like enzyme
MALRTPVSLSMHGFKPFLVFLTGLLLAGAAMARQPNVVLILADDLGYRDLGCQGHPAIRTPVLDKLAADGVRLTDFHVGVSVCTPSRMALLTGAYPVRVGWQKGVVGYPMGMRDGMSPEALTIAEIFKAEGYATGISGKWHIGDLPETRPHGQGFDWTYYIPSSNNQTDLIRRGDDIIKQPFENRLLTRQFTDEALGFIRTHKDRPFFLYLPFTAPHFPVEAHPDWKGRSKFGTYGDVVEELDHCIGEIVRQLDDAGIRDHTLIVFTSDNGPQKGQAASALPFRGRKWSALDGGTRVPCIANWPGVLPAGREFGGLVSAIDLLPTLSRACGIDWRAKSSGKPKIDGLDLWDALIGKTDASPRGELLFWHGMNPEPVAIRVGQWKLFFDRRDALEGLGSEAETPEETAELAACRGALSADGPNPPLLIRLSDDPRELLDRSAEFPEKVAAMRKRADVLIADLKQHGTLPIVRP